jgi:hypothetical protein
MVWCAPSSSSCCCTANHTHTVYQGYGIRVYTCLVRTRIYNGMEYFSTYYTCTSGDRHPKTSRSGAGGVMQAQVRIQAYKLADIVVAIPAVDLAVEAVVQGRGPLL